MNSQLSLHRNVDIICWESLYCHPHLCRNHVSLSSRPRGEQFLLFGRNPHHPTPHNNVTPFLTVKYSWFCRQLPFFLSGSCLLSNVPRCPLTSTACTSDFSIFSLLRATSPVTILAVSSWASLVAQLVKNLPAVQETWVRSLGGEDLLEKGMTTHSSILAQKIPWTEKTGGLQSMGLQRVRHDWATNTHTHYNMCHSFFQLTFLPYINQW